MKCPGPVGLLLMFATLVLAKPQDTATLRSTEPASESLKKLVNPLADVPNVSSDIILDIRTPPKIKPLKKHKDNEEFSHAGVAIPVDEDSLEMEEVTKKMNFYKLERPTTNSGLSTWILLSGQAASTTKKPNTTKKNTTTPIKESLNVFVTEKPLRQIKPIFKKKPVAISTTPKVSKVTISSTKAPVSPTKAPISSTKSQQPMTTKPPNQTTKMSIPAQTTKLQTSTPIVLKNHSVPSTVAPKKITKLTKVKASELSDAIKKTTTVSPTTLLKKKEVTSSTTTVKPTVATSTELAVNSSSLPLEAKNGEVDLSHNETKKKKSSNKRKKNKTRRRKPPVGNSTSLAKPAKVKKEKPVSTMLYNYLSREIMPTVGVGLVGLMVTAGLASYFLYPFGVAAKRADTVDRKDREGGYYYRDEYSGGMPEEEAIGKVIAGMPSNNLFENDYKPKQLYPNPNYRLVDRRAQIQTQTQEGVVRGTVENVPLTNNYKTVDKYNKNNEADEKKFVVGNVPKQIDNITPVTVPEHGPRSLRIESVTEDLRAMRDSTRGRIRRRRKRDVSQVSAQNNFPWKGLRSRRLQLPSGPLDDRDNEISNNLVDVDNIVEATTMMTAEEPESTTTNTELGLNTVPVTTLPPPDPSLKTDFPVQLDNNTGVNNLGLAVSLIASFLQMFPYAIFLYLRSVLLSFISS